MCRIPSMADRLSGCKLRAGLTDRLDVLCIYTVRLDAGALNRK